jgi:hypothetical protein
MLLEGGRARADLSGRQATLEVTIPATGWYAVLATREDVEEGTSSGNFVLGFEGSTAEVGGIGAMPDIGESTTPISQGQVAEGELSNEAYVSYYLISLTEGQGIMVTMQRTSGDLEPFVAVMSADLDVLERGRPNLAGTESALAFKPEAEGWYVIAATRADFDAGTTIGGYSIRVE